MNRHNEPIHPLVDELRQAWCSCDPRDIDEALRGLRNTIEVLAHQFHGRFDRAEIETAVFQTALRGFGSPAILKFVPVLVERPAREQLTTPKNCFQPEVE